MLHLVSGISSLYLFVNFILVPVPPHPTTSPITSSSFDSPLCSSVTPFVFRRKCRPSVCLCVGCVVNYRCCCWRGTEQYCGVEGKVDIINSTFGKALGGAAGASGHVTVVTSHWSQITWLRSSHVTAVRSRDCCDCCDCYSCTDVRQHRLTASRHHCNHEIS